MPMCWCSCADVLAGVVVPMCIEYVVYAAELLRLLLMLSCDVAECGRDIAMSLSVVAMSPCRHVAMSNAAMSNVAMSCRLATSSYCDACILRFHIVTDIVDIWPYRHPIHLPTQLMPSQPRGPAIAATLPRSCRYAPLHLHRCTAHRCSCSLSSYRLLLFSSTTRPARDPPPPPSLHARARAYVRSQRSPALTCSGIAQPARTDVKMTAPDGAGNHPGDLSDRRASLRADGDDRGVDSRGVESRGGG